MEAWFQLGEVLFHYGPLRTANDLIVTLATWNVAVYSNNLDAAIELAQLLTEPQRSSEARVLGYLFIAHLELARGRLRAARAAVAEAAGLEPATGGEYAALFAALPFLPTTLDQVEEAIRGLQTLDANAVAPNVTPNVFFTAHNGIHQHIQSYVLGMLQARAGRDTAALRHAAHLEELWQANNRPELARNLHLALKA